MAISCRIKRLQPYGISRSISDGRTGGYTHAKNGQNYEGRTRRHTQDPSTTALVQTTTSLTHSRIKLRSTTQFLSIMRTLILLTRVIVKIAALFFACVDHMLCCQLAGSLLAVGRRHTACLETSSRTVRCVVGLGAEAASSHTIIRVSLLQLIVSQHASSHCICL